MADVTFNTPTGQTVARERMIAYLNTGTSSAPVWSPFGKRVEDSSMEYDWDSSTTRDILGNTWGKLKKPIVTQDFDPWDLDGGDAALVHIWNLAVKDQNAMALANQDVLVVHFYAGEEATPFAERYPSSMIEVGENGGEGGGELGVASTVTFGGTRAVGTASKNAETGAITFNPAAA